MVRFADEILSRLQILAPSPGSVLVVHLAEDRRNWNGIGLEEVIEQAGLAGVILLPPGCRVEQMENEEKVRLARQWLREETLEKQQQPTVTR